jgi:hypothetical protein
VAELAASVAPGGNGCSSPLMTSPIVAHQWAMTAQISRVVIGAQWSQSLPAPAYFTHVFIST